MRRHYKKSERRREGITTTSLVCTIQKKRRNKIRNLWLWLVCCSLLPTCNFHHRPFTFETAVPVFVRLPDHGPSVALVFPSTKEDHSSQSIFSTHSRRTAVLWRGGHCRMYLLSLSWAASLVNMPGPIRIQFGSDRKCWPEADPMVLCLHTGLLLDRIRSAQIWLTQSARTQSDPDWFRTVWFAHTPNIAFRHLPQNSARFSYATEGAPIFISAQLSSDAVSALRKVPVLIWLYKQPSAKART